MLVRTNDPFYDRPRKSVHYDTTLFAELVLRSAILVTSMAATWYFGMATVVGPKLKLLEFATASIFATLALATVVTTILQYRNGTLAK